MQTAPDTCTTPTHPAASGAASFRRLTLATAAALALAACAPQNAPVLSSADGSTGGGAAPVSAPTPVEVHEAVGNAIDVVKPEPRP